MENKFTISVILFQNVTVFLPRTLTSFFEMLKKLETWRNSNLTNFRCITYIVTTSNLDFKQVFIYDKFYPIKRIYYLKEFNIWHRHLFKSNIFTHYQVCLRKFPELIFKGTLSGLTQFLASENPSKMMKNAFYFTLKALFVLKIFKFLSWLFGHAEKRLD